MQAMAEDGTMYPLPDTPRSFDVTTKEELATALKEEAIPTREELTMESYRSKFFQATRIKEKTAFTINVETLEILRNVLHDLHERVSMASYIDNILREHLSVYRELLNQATAKQRRKTTIP